MLKNVLSRKLILIVTSQIWNFMGWLEYSEQLNISRTEYDFSMKLKYLLTCAPDGTPWRVIIL